MKIGLLLIIVGILLFALSFVPLATVIVDDTPPVVSSTVPADGVIYQYLATINVYANDPETGIAWIHYTDTSPEMAGKVVSLNYKMMIGENEAWESNDSEVPPGFPEYVAFPGVYTPGIYNFEYIISNDNAEASLTTTVSGTYTIYTALEGDWYINNVLITDPAQELHLDTKTLTFKFVMTAGGTVVSTSVAWTGGDTGSMALTEVVAGTWEGSNTFTHGGTYTIELKASDGTTDVVMSIVPITMPGGITFDLNLLQVAGVGVAAVGVIVSVRERKKRR